MIAPLYELRTRPLLGTRYTEYALYVGGALCHAQLSPYSEDEIEDRVRAHLRADPVPPVREVSAKPGPKAKSVTATGFRWTNPEDE